MISNDLVTEIKARFQELRMEFPDRKTHEYKPRPKGWPHYNFTLSEFCKKAYLETKEFFDVHQDTLSPTDKMIVFQEYINLWKITKGNLDIQDTDFADPKFSKYFDSYNDHVPMVAGFNLKNIAFKNFNESDMIFIAVDISGATFDDFQLPYSRFYNCNFMNSDFARANFSQCAFIQCNLEKVGLSKAYLERVHFKNCIMYQIKYGEKILDWVEECFNDNLLTASRDGKVNEVIQLTKIFPSLLNSLDEEDNTPLHLATLNGHVEIVEFLLKNNAEKNIKNKNSQTALDFAKEYGYPAIFSQLQDVKTSNTSPSELGLWGQKQHLSSKQNAKENTEENAEAERIFEMTSLFS